MLILAYITLAGYVGVTLSLCSLGIGAKDWQNWVIILCLMIIQISSFIRGMEKEKENKC